MRRHMKTFLGYLLTITILLSDLPIVTKAATEEDTENVVPVTETVSSSEEPHIIRELTEKRDEITKYFAMSDGTIKACIYPQNVHYLENGKYEEIDNTLVENSVEDKSYYENKKNSFSVKIPESFTDDYIEFSDDNGYVKFKLQGATNKKLEKITKNKNADEEDMTIVKNANDKAVFKKVKGNVDIEYDLSGNKLKETIVLYKKTKDSFMFDIQTSAARVVKNNDNSVSFFSALGTEIYKIASPYMTDSAGEYSNAIETKLIASSSGYTLTYKPDYEWLSAKEREYPVRIDPTLVQAIYKDTVTDTYITNIQPADDIRGAWDVLNIGKRVQSVNGTQITMRGLIRFDIPTEIGKNDCIVDAKLDLVHYTDSAAVSVNGLQVDVHELTTGFTEGGTYWGNQPYYDPIITDYVLVNTGNTFSGSTLSYDSYNLTKLVNKWHNGSANHGIMLKIHDENATVSSDTQVYYFARQSLYYGSVSKFVEITYRNTIGLEDYWSYTTQDFGQYGTGYVNNYNGNLVYVHDDVTFHSLINGFTLSHVYNSCRTTTQPHATNGIMGYYGAGWTLNLVQKLEPVTVSGNSSVKYKYTDGDGTEHYLVQTSDGKIVDEDGLGYTYADISEGDLTRQLTYKDGTILKFDSLKYLRRIIDSNGNTISLEYGAIPNVDNFLSSITTSSGGIFTLSYDGNYNLASITDNAQRVTTFNYDSGNLTEIHYPDGSVLKFEYDSNNHLLQNVISPDKTKLQYDYNASNRKVSATRFYGTDGTASTGTSFQYSQNQTRVIDSVNRGITYQFDTWGRATSVYDDEQNIYSQTYNPTVTNGSGIFNNNKLASSSNGATYVNNLLTNPVFANGLDSWIIYTQNQNAEHIVVSDNGLVSSKSIKISNDIQTIETIMQAVPISEPNTYTFSGYLKTENVQSTTLGASLEVVVEGQGGNRYYYSEFLKGTTDVEIDNGFQFVSVTFSLEEGETVNRATAGLFNASGTVYIDSLQFEKGNTANAINLIDNSGFEKYDVSSLKPTGYNVINDSNISSSESLSDAVSCKLVGAGTENRSINKYMNLSGDAGDIYTVGGWAKANSVPNHKQDKSNEADFTLHVFAFYNDSTVEHEIIKFNEYVTDWQCASKTFSIASNYTSIQVYCSYDFNCNAVYFDNIFLYRDTMKSYTYDNNGNVISTADYASQNENFQYNNNNLAKLITPTGSSYEYLYDTKNNMTFARSGEGLAYDVEYDSHGNAVSTSIGSHSYSTSIQSGKTYYIRLKSDGKYLTVANAGTGNSTNVIEAAFTAGAHQKWKVESTSDGYYILTAQHADNMVLDVANAANSEDTNVQIHSKNDSSAQKFKIEPQSDYTYKLTPECSTDGKILTVNHAVTSNNVTILSAQGSNNPDQEWYFEDVEQPIVTSIENGACYQFRAQHSGKYIDVLEEETAVGTYLQQYEQNFKEDQRYIVRKYEDTEYYTLTPLHAQERLVEVSTEMFTYGSTSYTYPQLGDSIVTERKLFKIEYNADYGAFQILPKCDETLALDVVDGNITNGTRLLFTERGYYANRFFILEKMSDTITSSATYQDNGNYLHTTTDARGNTTTYTYDTSRGLQTGVTDAKGNTTEYTYNALNDRLESVKTADSTVSYQYETNGAIKNITTPSGTVYNFVYDTFGRTTQILVGNQKLSETIYKNAYSALVTRFNYGNGAYKTYEYDNQDRLISEGANGSTSRTYLYDKRGNVAQINDFITNVITKFNYDLIGRTVGIKSSDGQSMNFIYDKYNRLSLSKWTMGDMSLSTGYVYGDNSVEGQKTGMIYGVNLNGTQKLGYQYDELTRLKTRTISTEAPFVTEYGYLEGATANTTTTLVKTIKNGNDTLEYTYDEVGNITSVKKNGTIIEQYTYDALNQLVSAAYGGNTYTYSYDNGGNITEVKKNGVAIKSYTYGNTEWKDLLTGFNGETITYDTIGNPLTYRNGMSFTWQKGRQLASVSQNGTAIATYTYNADGLRTSKTVNGVTTEYYWMNGTLHGQKTGEEYIYFLCDESGSAYGFISKNGTTETYYYYEFNLQGDIIGIVDSVGNKVVEYTYGAWGDILSVTGTMADTIGQKNPLRYRGYYYDAETGFYYLNSRYYDPEICRFINADGYVSTGTGILGNNMFSYCHNCPINKADSSGMAPYELFDTVDEAALNFAKYYNAKSINAKQEYGSTIYRYTYAETRSSVEKIKFNILGIPITIRFLVTTDVLISKYYYNTPWVGNDGESVVPNLLGVGVPVSTVHTHANYNPIYNNENFSDGSFAKGDPGDIDWCNLFRMNGYLATPGGYFKKYTYKNRNDANGGVTIISDAIPWDQNSPNH